MDDDFGRATRHTSEHVDESSTPRMSDDTDLDAQGTGIDETPWLGEYNRVAVRSDLAGTVAHPPEGLIDRVLTHWPARGVKSRQYKTVRTSQGMELGKIRQDLPGKRDSVRPAHFHAFGGNLPDCASEIELRPLRMPKLAWARHDVR